MNKKGSSHVDWAISMGIFLTYILSMFILIQPGIEPIQKNDQLVEVVEKNFMDEITVTMTRTPIKITQVTGNYAFSISDALPFQGTQNHATLVEEGGIPTALYTSQASEISLTFDTEVSSNKRTYIIESPFNFPSASDPGFPSSPTDPETGLPIFDYRIGASEKIRGTSDPLPNFCSNYDIVAERWGFPLNKRFSIRQYNPSTTSYDIFVCHKEEPYEGANVFVKEIKVPILGETGNIVDQALINLRIW